MRLGNLIEREASADSKPTLSRVTLVAISGISLEATIRALEQSMDQISFGSVLLLSPTKPSSLNNAIEWRPIRPIDSRQEYSRFMLQELAHHIGTDFALCVQWDGYVIDGRNWRPEFLEYDYIGAPWPHFDDRRVGNGGFSLRSKRLVEASKAIPFDPAEAEDVAICRHHRELLEQGFGIRFAPEALAHDFAFERSCWSGREFGFHGLFNMRKLIGREAFVELLTTLDPGTIGRLEMREIIRQSLLHLDLHAARLAFRNRIAA